MVQSPQYALRVNVPTFVRITLTQHGAGNAPAHAIGLVVADVGGGRINNELTQDAVIGSSGPYAPRTSVTAECTLPPTSTGHTLLASTFAPGDECDFTLTIVATRPIKFSALPEAGAESAATSTHVPVDDDYDLHHHHPEAGEEEASELGGVSQPTAGGGYDTATTATGSAPPVENAATGQSKVTTHTFRLTDEWTGYTAGGAWTYPTGANNPQFLLTVDDADCSVRVSLRQLRSSSEASLHPVGLIVASLGGARVEGPLEREDIVVTGGAYAAVETVSCLAALTSEGGPYTIFLSTRTPGEEAVFVLEVVSSSPNVRLTKLLQRTLLLLLCRFFYGSRRAH